jgi:hypothetical protein
MAFIQNPTCVSSSRAENSVFRGTSGFTVSGAFQKRRIGTATGFFQSKFGAAFLVFAHAKNAKYEVFV